MTTTERTMAVGVFTDRAFADRALEDLQNAGFTNDQIGFILPDQHAHTGEQRMSNAATGAVSGGVLGGLIGAAVSLLIPGIGPALAGGILAGVVVGAVAGGLAGALVHMGVPEEEARYYQEELERGHILVTVDAQNRYQEAVSILRRDGAYDASVRRDMPPATTAQASTSQDTMVPPIAAYPGAYGPTGMMGAPGTVMPIPVPEPRTNVTTNESEAELRNRNAEAEEQEASTDQPQQSQQPARPAAEDEAEYNPNIPHGSQT